MPARECAECGPVQLFETDKGTGMEKKWREPRAGRGVRKGEKVEGFPLGSAEIDKTPH